MQGSERAAPTTCSHFTNKVTRLGGLPAVYIEFRLGDGATMRLYHVYRRYAVDPNYSSAT